FRSRGGGLALLDRLDEGVGPGLAAVGHVDVRWRKPSAFALPPALESAFGSAPALGEFALPEHTSLNYHLATLLLLSVAKRLGGDAKGRRLYDTVRRLRRTGNAGATFPDFKSVGSRKSPRRSPLLTYSQVGLVPPQQCYRHSRRR